MCFFHLFLINTGGRMERIDSLRHTQVTYSRALLRHHDVIVFIHLKHTFQACTYEAMHVQVIGIETCWEMYEDDLQ